MLSGDLVVAEFLISRISKDIEIYHCRNFFNRKSRRNQKNKQI